MSSVSNWAVRKRSACAASLLRRVEASLPGLAGSVPAGASGGQPKEDHLIFDSLNSTCLRATGSYLVLVIFSVIVREFFLVT